MQSLDPKFRLQGHSTPQIVGEFKRVWSELSDLTYDNGVLERTHLLNALVLNFMRMEAPARRRFADLILGKLEYALSTTDEERAAALARIGLVHQSENAPMGPTDREEPPRQEPTRRRGRKGAG